MSHQPLHLSRRRFLQTTSALPPRRCLRGSWRSVQLKRRSRPRKQPLRVNRLRLALVGCGGMGLGDARNAKRFGSIVALCDVDASHLAAGKKNFPDAEGYADFRRLLERKDIDAVICATVDHWHTLVSIAAMKAGKDVYCEKPLTLTIDEGKRLVDVQRETGRVLQTGTQQRSSIHFRLACDLIRNGRIGKIEKVEVWLPAGLRGGPFATSDRARRFRLRLLARTDARSSVRQGADSLQLPLLVGVLRRHDDRLGRTSQRHRPVGPGSGRFRAGEYRGQADGGDDPRRIHGGQRVRRDLHLCQR